MYSHYGPKEYIQVTARYRPSGGTLWNFRFLPLMHAIDIASMIFGIRYNDTFLKRIGNFSPRDSFNFSS